MVVETRSKRQAIYLMENRELRAPEMEKASAPEPTTCKFLFFFLILIFFQFIFFTLAENASINVKEPKTTDKSLLTFIFTLLIFIGAVGKKIFKTMYILMGLIGGVYAIFNIIERYVIGDEETFEIKIRRK